MQTESWTLIAGLLGAATVGALGAGALIGRSPRRAAARPFVTPGLGRAPSAAAPQLRPSRLELFPHLRRPPYASLTDALRLEGFTLLGDVEDLAWSIDAPGPRRCARLFAGDSGTIRCAIQAVEVPRGGLLRALRPPSDLMVLVFATETSEGEFITTVNTAGLDATTWPPRLGVRLLPPDTPWRELLRTHRARVRALTPGWASIQIVPVYTLEDAVASISRGAAGASAPTSRVPGRASSIEPAESVLAGAR